MLHLGMIRQNYSISLLHFVGEDSCKIIIELVFLNSVPVKYVALPFIYKADSFGDGEAIATT